MVRIVDIVSENVPCYEHAGIRAMRGTGMGGWPPSAVRMTDTAAADTPVRRFGHAERMRPRRDRVVGRPRGAAARTAAESALYALTL